MRQTIRDMHFSVLLSEVRLHRRTGQVKANHT
jgi:hypothetical protein